MECRIFAFSLKVLKLLKSQPLVIFCCITDCIRRMKRFEVKCCMQKSGPGHMPGSTRLASDEWLCIAGRATGSSLIKVLAEGLSSPCDSLEELKNLFMTFKEIVRQARIMQADNLEAFGIIV